MRRCKHADYPLAHAQRNRDFRERGVSAPDVIRILAHVRRIAQLADGRDMTDHAFLSDGLMAATRALLLPVYTTLYLPPLLLASLVLFGTWLARRRAGWAKRSNGPWRR